VLSRTEEIYQAILIALVPFLLAWPLVWYVPPARSWPFYTAGSWADRRADYKLVTSAIYSEAIFRAREEKSWKALTNSTRRQLRFLSWFYLLVLIESAWCGWIGYRYGRKKHGRIVSFIARSMIFKQMSGWHFLLTPFLFAGNVTVDADILSTGDILYKGKIYEYAVDRDGDLVGLALALPFRFDKEARDRDVASGNVDSKKDHWIKIRGNRLYLFADRIQNINLRYQTEMPAQDVLAEFVERQLGIPVSVEITRKAGNS
jgi:hypothetical protein